MKERFEKIYLPEEEKKEPEEAGKIEVPEEEWQTLEIIAKRVGGDFGMKVKVGPPYLEEINPLTGRKEKIYYEAFEDPVERSITINPLVVIENPKKAKSHAGHEGEHRAIDRGYHEIGLSEEQIKDLLSEKYIGFSSFENIALKDPRADTWGAKKFPGLKELHKEKWDEDFREENVLLVTPEVNLIISKLGRYPRYAEAASEIARFWHKGSYSQKLRPETEKFLRRTQKWATEYQNTYPPTDRSLREKEVIEIVRECFKKYHEYIWPEVKKLVEMDLHTEEQRQMMQEFRQKQKELEQKMKEMKNAQEKGDKQKQEKLQKEIEGLKKELDPFNGLPEDAKKELQEQIDKAIQKAAEELNKEIEEKQRQAEEARQKQEELDKEIKDLEEKARSATGKEKEDLEKQIQEKRAEKLAQEIKQKQAEDELKQIQEALEDIQSGQEMPYPEDKLSDKTKQELDKLFKNLPKEKREELKEKAKRQLEDFEDAINKKMEGKLNEDKPESHRERRERGKREKETEERRTREEEEKRRLEKKLEKMRREKMTEYDKAYEEVADIINSLYIRLKKFFLPERHPKWRKGFPTGSRLDLEKAMQAEADPRYLEKIWERKTIPHKLDYRFSILVDLSGSMQGEKIEETFKGMVVLAEVLEKLGIQYEISGFQDDIISYKSFRERLNKNLRDNLSIAKKEPSNEGVYNQAKWNDDGFCLNEAYQRLVKNKGKNNFLIVLSDGEPVPSPAHSGEEWDLKKIVQDIREEKQVKLIGIGLGEDTEHVKEYYPVGFANMKMRVSEGERRQGQKDFAEAFADLLEDMIRYPEKY